MKFLTFDAQPFELRKQSCLEFTIAMNLEDTDDDWLLPSEDIIITDNKFDFDSSFLHDNLAKAQGENLKRVKKIF